MIKVAKKITQLCVLVSTVFLLGCGGEAETHTDPSKFTPEKPVSDWEMVWSDEFDDSSIDDKKWTHEVNCLGGGNAEKQCYTDSEENSHISDGKLQIVALPAEEGAEQPYTSARLITRYKADFKYGRFEINAKLPSGQGSWPAFWMMPTDETYGGWPKSGEIDILEAVNLKTSDADDVVENRVYGTLHYGKESPNNSYSGKSYALPDGANPADDFHTYAIEWQEGEIRWYIDDYLYATQRKSQVRYNSKDQAVGLSHRGWFTENYDAVTGELTTYWDNAPFDQQFYMIINFAVGGDWPVNVNNLGVDAEAFTNGQKFEIDYVRVYQCKQDPDTGKGCETVRGGYDSLEDALVEGLAPFPKLPSSGIAQNLNVFTGSMNLNWPAWVSENGIPPALTTDDEKGEVIEFYTGETPSVNGFSTRKSHNDFENTGGQESIFDASPLLETGTVSFDLKIVTPPNDSDLPWSFKIESREKSTEVALPLTDSVEGVEPTIGEWQTYTFNLQTLADAGLDVSAIDVVMIFPDWVTGNGAIYRVANFIIGADAMPSPQLIVFEDEANTSWPSWVSSGGTTPTIEIDDDAHGAVVEFVNPTEDTVLGFISRKAGMTDPDAEPAPFDATGILANGVIQFDMKVVSMPDNADAIWSFKMEGNDDAASAVGRSLTDSVEGLAPTEGQWQTYTFKLSDLATDTFDMSAIDVLMVFPGWSTGNGAVFRIDNVKIYDPNASAGFVGHVLFDDKAKEQWSLWDCCAGSTPTVENDDTEHGLTAEFVVGATSTVMGLYAEDDVSIDAGNLLANGVVQFEMKVITAPNNADAVWKFKIEAGNPAAAVELDLSTSDEGVAPVVGQWQTYTYSLQSLFDKGLDINAIDIVMVFPAYGQGEGAVYRLDNVMIYDPASVPAPLGIVLYDNAQNTEWPIWDCCGGTTPTEEQDDASHGFVAEFVVGATDTVMGFLANDDVSFDASSILQNGVVKFDLKVMSAPNDASAAWKFKIEAGDPTAAVELDLSASQEGATPVVGQWQTYTFSLASLFEKGLDISAINIVMVFPTYGKGDGAVYRLDNVVITAP